MGSAFLFTLCKHNVGSDIQTNRNRRRIMADPNLLLHIQAAQTTQQGSATFARLSKLKSARHAAPCDSSAARSSSKRHARFVAIIVIIVDVIVLIIIEIVVGLFPFECFPDNNDWQGGSSSCQKEINLNSRQAIMHATEKRPSTRTGRSQHVADVCHGTLERTSAHTKECHTPRTTRNPTHDTSFGT